MQLDQKGANAEGHAALQDGATLRWGTAPHARFCATVNREDWNWEAGAANSRAERHAVLAFARGYTRTYPTDRVITCENTGC